LNLLRDWKKANKPVDRTKWAMPPQVVNAYYHPLLNELVFPAAILQAPAFDPDRDICANYGTVVAFSTSVLEIPSNQRHAFQQT
jgi:putative endopeptidase